MALFLNYRNAPYCKIVRLTLGKFGEFDKRLLYNLHQTTLQLTLQKLKALNFKPDIIHSVYWNSGHLAMALSNIWKIPYVHSIISNGKGRNIHGATGTAPQRIEVEEKVFKNATFIICVAQSEKNEICQYYNISRAKVIVAGQYVHPSFIYAAHNPYGFPRKSGINYRIESTYFSNTPSSMSNPSYWWGYKAFTYTGRMSLNKGVQYIVQAWYILYQKYEQLCPPLWLIGGGANDIEQLRLRLDIPENILCSLEEKHKIVWWGYLDENGISALYTRTLALVTHSLYEPGGRVAVEAMCEGVPVLATPNGFALDSIRNWKNGFLVPYGDVETLSIRLEHFIKQPYLSTIMGEQAKEISNIILKNWDFTATHISVYEAALIPNHTYSKKTYEYIFKDSSGRKLNIYPFNQLLIDREDIMNICIQNGINQITSIEELNIIDCSSLLWNVCAGEKEYYVKIPYDRINLNTLWEPLKDESYVISSKKRYNAEIGALLFANIPSIIGKDDFRNAIIREKYENSNLSNEEKLDSAIHRLNSFYDENLFRDDFNIELEIETALAKNIEYSEIDQLYSSLSLSQYSWQNYFKDYSLRVELLRWKHYYMDLSQSARQKVAPLFEVSYDIVWNLSQNEKQLKFTITHGGFDFKNLICTPETILLDNEKIHSGFPGIDFSDLIISYVRLIDMKETYELWKVLLNKLSNTIIPKDLLIGWIILGTYKEAVSDAALMNEINPFLLQRIKTLLQLV